MGGEGGLSTALLKWALLPFPHSVFFVPPLEHLSRSALHQSYLCLCFSSPTRLWISNVLDLGILSPFIILVQGLFYLCGLHALTEFDEETVDSPQEFACPLIHFACYFGEIHRPLTPIHRSLVKNPKCFAQYLIHGRFSEFDLLGDVLPIKSLYSGCRAEMLGGRKRARKQSLWSEMQKSMCKLWK